MTVRDAENSNDCFISLKPRDIKHEKKEKIITLNHIFIHYILKQLINHQI